MSMSISILVTGGSKQSRLKEAQKFAEKQSSRFDITTIDTSEERGIEVAKRTINQASKQPFQSKLNSIIIAEAQNLTPEAQNSLLKTLEEPSAKTQLILTAPSTDSVLPTLASRCLEVRVGRGEALSAAELAPKANLKLSERLSNLDKLTLEQQLLQWERQLSREASDPNSSQARLQKLHRYSKTLLKLKKAENYSVNKKLLILIAAIEQPSET